MSLALALNTALTGLHVNQRTMAVISNNIANANTEGYSRQIVDLESMVYGGNGAGVRIEDVTRKVDKYLQTSIYNQTSSTGYSSAITEYYVDIQNLLGDPSLGNSIDEHISTFFTDLAQVAETPERTSTRAAVIQSALTISREISNLATSLEELRWQSDMEIRNTIKTLNTKIEELFFTNEKIAEAEAFGAPIATLLDKRDMLVEDIAEYIDVRVNERENYTVDLYAGDGINLLDYGYSRLEYDGIQDLGVLLEEGEIEPVLLQSLGANGEVTGIPINLVSGGTSSQIEARFDDGRLAGLLAIRDTVIPEILQQLDQLSAQLRDGINEIHNEGSGYPPAPELTATALYDVNQRSLWSGSIAIAALNDDGTPAPNAFLNEVTGTQPLTLDLATLYSGASFGEVDTQTIIDEINNHFGVPQNRMSVGNFNNVQLALVSDRVPGLTNSIEFDFDIQNLSGASGEFWVENVQVLDDTAADITLVNENIPIIDLDASNTFATSLGSNVVTVTTDDAHDLSNGDTVRLNDPGLAINGIPAAEFDGYFVINNVTATTFEVTVVSNAVAGGGVNVAGQTASPPYDTVETGGKTRLQQQGTITANLAGNPGSSYYDINVDIRVLNEDGSSNTTTVTYRVLNPQENTTNNRISARAVTAGDGVLTVPTDNRPLLRALLVDEDGNELPNIGGSYGQREGYLKIESMRDGITFAIEDYNSTHLGLPSDVPPRQGDGRGFSHHYGLNNFFTNNELTDTGDTVKGSAVNLALEERLTRNPSYISTGNLQLSNQFGNSGNPVYTLERYSGDQTIIQRMAELGINPQRFDAAGSLPNSVLTFSGYAGEMLGYISANTIAAKRAADNDIIVLEGYIERADAVSGVNLDEELANTIIYQNAYAASARVINVTDELFETLLSAF